MLNDHLCAKGHDIDQWGNCECDREEKRLNLPKVNRVKKLARPNDVKDIDIKELVEKMYDRFPDDMQKLTDADIAQSALDAFNPNIVHSAKKPWNSKCDCGTCSDCDLRMILLDKGLIAYYE